VKTSGIPHVVLLSSVGAQHAQGTGPIRSLHHAESVIWSAAKNLNPCSLLQRACPVPREIAQLPDLR